jgi:hypothetical protein
LLDRLAIGSEFNLVEAQKRSYKYQTGLVQGGEIKPRRAAYGDAPPCIRHLRHPVTGADLHGARPTLSWHRIVRLVTPFLPQ